MISPAQDIIGMPREQIDTPALLVDMERLEANLLKMATHFRKTGKNLRPHIKSHKCLHIARMQLEAGASGITCAKVGEAEVMAAAGIDDILIANQVVGPRKQARLMQAAVNANLMVAVADPGNLLELERAALVAGVNLRVLLEINIGHDRCGLLPGPQVVQLARRANELRQVRFAGIMGYEGHIIDLEDREERDRRAHTCLQRLVDVRADLEHAGLPVEICSSSGTGDYYLATSFDGITEVQAGSYALMDAAYARLGLGFEQALTVLTMVTCRPSPDQVITDAGLKTVTPEHGMPVVVGRDDLVCHALSEEHGRLRSDRGPVMDLALGDLLEFIPGHGCTTVNLHDRMYALRNGVVEAILDVSARGKVQ